MEVTSPRSATALPVLSLALVALAAASFGVGDLVETLDPAIDSLVAMASLVGLAFLVWAVLTGVWTTVLLVRGSIVRSRIDVALVAAAFGLLAVVLWTHPWWGSGTGDAV